MKMRRIVSAESKAGVVMQVSDVLDTETADRVTNIWGFDKIPQLPLTPDQVLGEYKRLGIFGPKDSVRVDLQVIPPEKAGVTDPAQWLEREPSKHSNESMMSIHSVGRPSASSHSPPGATVAGGPVGGAARRGVLQHEDPARRPVALGERWPGSRRGACRP